METNEVAKKELKLGDLKVFRSDSGGGDHQHQQLCVRGCQFPGVFYRDSDCGLSAGSGP